MHARVLLIGLLLAGMVGGYALAFEQAPPTDGQHIIYAPLVAHNSGGAPQAAATATPTGTSTATAAPATATPSATAEAATATSEAATTTATATTSAIATATAATPANCDPEADLSGALVADSQGRIVNRSAACAYAVGLAAYRAFDRHIGKQELFDATTATILPGQTIDLTVDVPDCATQIDLFYGPLLPSLDGQRYGERLLASHFVNSAHYCVPGTPAPTAPVTPTATSPAATATPTETPTETPGGGG